MFYKMTPVINDIELFQRNLRQNHYCVIYILQSFIKIFPFAYVLKLLRTAI
jgi:hypothetical protein